MMRKFNDVVRLAEFDRDIRKLKRRYRTLEDDLVTLVDTALFAFHKISQDYPWIVKLDDLGKVRLPVYKVKRFACRSIKGAGSRTGLRLIYAYDAAKDRVVLIEIYMKSDKEVEDRERVRQHMGVDE